MAIDVDSHRRAVRGARYALPAVLGPRRQRACVLTHYEAQFEANGWESAASQNGPQWVAATQGDTLFEVGWVQPPGERAAIMLLLSDQAQDG